MAVTLIAIALIAAMACGGGDDRAEGTPGALSGGITVFAASSLTAAFEDAGAAFGAAHPGTSVTFNFAGSPALRAQLDQGAAADVLATADETNMRAALEAKLVADAGRVFARNRLVIAVPASNPAGIASPADLARGGVKLVLAAEGVPVGDYARESLARMEADPAYGAGFRGRALANVRSNEPNVKAVIAKVQLGEADAGIVYQTDVTDEVRDAVKTIEIPDAFNVIAAYPVAVTAHARRVDVARAFIEYLLSSEGQAILKDHGFLGAE